MPVRRFCLQTLFASCLIAVATAAGSARQATPSVDPLAARVDPYTARQRVVVMTDIANLMP